MKPIAENKGVPRDPLLTKRATLRVSKSQSAEKARVTRGSEYKKNPLRAAFPTGKGGPQGGMRRRLDGLLFRAH